MQCFQHRNLQSCCCSFCQVPTCSFFPHHNTRQGLHGAGGQCRKNWGGLQGGAAEVDCTVTTGHYCTHNHIMSLKKDADSWVRGEREKGGGGGGCKHVCVVMHTYVCARACVCVSVFVCVCVWERERDSDTEREREREREMLSFVGCLTSQQHASVSQGRICSILCAATLR